MGRFFATPRQVEVFVDGNGHPSSIVWRGSRHRVQICNHWLLEDEWWHREQVRLYYRLRTRSALVCIVYRDADSGNWYLERILD